MFKTSSIGTRVVHREYLFDVITSPTAGAFNIDKVPIQPASFGSFPWLSASAEQYQEYKLNGAVFEFKSNSYNALASVNTASGTVVMTTNYNPLEPPYSSKLPMEQTQYTCSAKPSVDLLHPIECSKLETPTSILYTRVGNSAPGDLRLYDWGNFYIATVGMQGSSTNIGELWITYDITLLKPRLGATADVADHYILPVGSIETGGTGYFGLVGAGTTPQLQPSSDMGTFLTSSDGIGYDTINWPEGYSGNIMIIYQCPLVSVAGAALAAGYGYNLGGGANYLTLFSRLITPNASNQYNGNFVYGNTGGVCLVLMLSITNGGTCQFTGGTTGADPLAGDLFINAMPVSLVD
jgi:hypothetical protein